MPKQYDDCTWIGLFGVTGPPDNVQLQGCLGAYVTALAVADDERRFAERVAKNLADIGLESGEIVWSELLKERLQRYDIDDCLLKLAGEASQVGEVRFGTFHAWESEE